MYNIISSSVKNDSVICKPYQNCLEKHKKATFQKAIPHGLFTCGKVHGKFVFEV